MQFTQTQLQTFPSHLIENVQFLSKEIKNEDVLQEAIANLLSGQPLEKAEKNARCDTWRNAYQPAGWVSLDDIQLIKEEEQLQECRAATLDAATESLLKLLEGGTAALGRQLGVGQRRAQQILKKEIKRLRDGGGQDDLFGRAA